MHIVEPSKQDVCIEYPCHWNYKVVGRDRFQMKRVLNTIFQERECKISDSKSSRTGKFVSLNIDLLVHNDDERRYFYDRLRESEEFLHIL